MGALCTNHRSMGDQEEEENGGGGSLPDENGNVAGELRYEDNDILLIPDDNDEEGMENDAIAARETVEREIESHRKRTAFTKSVFHQPQTDQDTV